MAVKETDFMYELEAANNMKPARPAILMLFAIISFILFFFLWAGVTEIEELTRGQGQVVPSQDVQIVQSLEGGIVEELLVRAGDIVKKDQVLMRLSDVQFSSEERGTQARFLGLAAKKARLLAEANGTDFELPAEVAEKAPQIAANEKALYDSRQRELQNAYAILDERISKATAELGEVKAQINRFYSSKKSLNEELPIVSNQSVQACEPCRSSLAGTPF